MIEMVDFVLTVSEFDEEFCILRKYIWRCWMQMPRVQLSVTSCMLGICVIRVNWYR